MAYNNNKGPQHSGDIQFEEDPDETQIDFANDNIKLKAGGINAFDINATRLSGGVGMPLSASSFWGKFYGDGSGITGVGAGSVAAAGSTTQVQYNDGGAFAGSSNMTFNGTTLTVNGLASTGTTTLGDAGADTVTINAATIDIPNVAAGTDNTVVVYNGSTLVTDEIDSRVWGSSLVDKTGTPADNQISVFTDSDTIEGTNDLTFNGTKLDVTGHITASAGISGSYLLADSLDVAGHITSSAGISASYFMGDGSGLTGITATATPAGSNTQVQFNNGGSFAGSPNMTFNGTTLTVAGLSNTGATVLGDNSADTTTIAGSQIILSALSAVGSAEATTLVYDGNSIRSDEIDMKVWDLKLVDYTGTPANDQVAVFNGSTKTIEGTNNFKFIDGLDPAVEVTGEITASTGISASYFMGDGSRLTGIAAGGGGTPAGSNTQIQFNNGGAFGASSNLTFGSDVLTTQGLSVTADTTLGNTSGDSVTINAETITLANVPAGTDNTVLNI